MSLNDNFTEVIAIFICSYSTSITTAVLCFSSAFVSCVFLLYEIKFNGQVQ